MVAARADISPSRRQTEHRNHDDIFRKSIFHVRTDTSPAPRCESCAIRHPGLCRGPFTPSRPQPWSPVPQKHNSNPSSTPSHRTCTRTHIPIITKSFQGGWVSGQSVANLHLVTLSLKQRNVSLKLPVPKVLGSNPSSPYDSLFASVVVTSPRRVSWDTYVFARLSRAFWASSSSHPPFPFRVVTTQDLDGHISFSSSINDNASPNQRTSASDIIEVCKSERPACPE